VSILDLLTDQFHFAAGIGHLTTIGLQFDTANKKVGWPLNEILTKKSRAYECKLFSLCTVCVQLVSDN
jgi:hypothetical protein